MEIVIAGHDVAGIITAIGVLVSAISSSVAAVIVAKNGKKINEVHVLANSLSTRAEHYARIIGIEEGKLQEREGVAKLKAEHDTEKT
jgi:hypothetical protein